MASTADLMREKLQAVYPTGDKNIGALLQRYRADNGLEAYEDYVAHVAESALWVPPNLDGTNYASTPDHASFAVTDLDVRILMAPDTWPAAFLSNQFVGQWAAAPNAGWVTSIHPNGRPRFAVSTDGTNIFGLEADPIPFLNRTLHWYRVTFDGDNGAGGRTTTHYTAEYDGTTSPSWSQLGAPIVESGAVTIFNSTGELRTNWLWWGGCFLYIEVRNGINGTIIANPDFRGLAPGTTSFVDSTGKTWTLNGGAVIANAPGNVRDHENKFWNEFAP